MGLREIKKEQTRRLITDTAWRLFAERGFDHVTVAEVAREAQVAEATVFNYFASKEDLFYGRFESFGAQLVDRVATRPAGQPALVAFRDFLFESGGLPTEIESGDSDALAAARTVHRIIADSPALQAREQQVLNNYTDALAAVLAAEQGGDDGGEPDVATTVVAHALMGVHRTLIRYVRRRIMDDEGPWRLATDMREVGTRAFAQLADGLADYARKPES